MIASNGRPARAGRWILFALAFCAMECAAASLTVEVEGAVVSLHSPVARAGVRPAHAQVAQPGDGLEPKVLPLPLGSEVRFSASDGRRHELYAFSPARRFTFSLYAGHAEASLRFETSGVVDYGCAIHDAAIGYVVVLDTPCFATIDAGGHARFDAPDGDYTLQVWHERQARGGSRWFARCTSRGMR